MFIFHKLSAAIHIFLVQPFFLFIYSLGAFYNQYFLWAGQRISIKHSCNPDLSFSVLPVEGKKTITLVLAPLLATAGFNC